MAKELPFFKFEPSEWDSGNIQMCSRESKGLFIDLCSLYWNRLGELPYALALQKLCNGNKDALQELVNVQIIAVIDGNIVIEFLEEQLSEFGNVSEKRRKAANKRWSDANALQMQSKSNAIREDKIREEKKRGEEIPRDFDEIFLKAFDEITCESYKVAFKGIDLGAELQKFRIKCDNDKSKYYGRDAGGLRTAFQYQLQNLRKNGKQSSTTEQRLNELDNYFAAKSNQ